MSKSNVKNADIHIFIWHTGEVDVIGEACINVNYDYLGMLKSSEKVIRVYHGV